MAHAGYLSSFRDGKQMNAHHPNVGKLLLPGRGAKYCDEWCLSVCLHNSKTTWPSFSKLFVHIAYGCAWLGSPLATLRYVMYFRFLWMTSCSHILALWRVMRVPVTAIEHNEHDIHPLQLLLNDKDRKYIYCEWYVSCAPGSKSAIYDCLVWKRRLNEFELCYHRVSNKICLNTKQSPRWDGAKWRCIQISGVNLVHSLGGTKKILPSPQIQRNSLFLGTKQLNIE